MPALYHLNRRSISLARKKTKRTTAASMARYMLRRDACGAWTGHLPAGVEASTAGVHRWLLEVGLRSRANGRLGDRLIVAIPVEVRRREQRLALMGRFGAALSRGRVPWFAALHDEHGNDRVNPHFHLFVRDRAYWDEDGKSLAREGPSVLGLGELGSTEALRATWEEVCNEFLWSIGSYARVDRRSHRARGLVAAPTRRRRFAA